MNMKLTQNPIKILFLLCLIVVFSSKAQTNPKESDDYKKYLKIYNQAKKYSDITVAKTALYELMVLDPADATLLDSLMFIYFEYNQYAPSVLVSMDVLQRNPNNLMALEISAISYENLQLYDKAVRAYESLYLRNNDLQTMYKIAFLQYNLKRFAEAKTSADIVIKNPQSDTLRIIFNPTRNTQEEVTMKSAILNLKGLMAKEQGNKEEARRLFTEALAPGDPFTFAQQNLTSLDEN